MRTAQPAAKEGPRINEEIRVREVQLIDKDGANKGVTEITAALALVNRSVGHGECGGPGVREGLDSTTESYATSAVYATLASLASVR